VRPVLWLRAVAACCAVLGLFPLANAMTNGAAMPWWPLAVREWLLRGAVVIVIAALLAALLGPRIDTWYARAERELLAIPGRVFGTAVAALALVAAAFYARFCFAGQPFTTDEMAQLWHGRILLSGHIAAVPEPLREFFNTAPVFDRDRRWFSQYPIGGPAFIALGLLLRAEWLVNPVLLALSTWNVYRFLAIAFDELTARVTTLVFVISPMVLIMAASQMNHLPALAFATLGLASLAAWDRAATRRALWTEAAIVGAAVGVVALVRPLDAALVGLVIGGFQLWRVAGGGRGDRERWASLGVQIVAGAIPLAVLLWANMRTTGRPFLFGYEALNGPEHGLGFHADPTGQYHTVEHGLVLVSGYMMRLSRYFLEWPVPGVLLLVVGLVAIDRPTRWDALLATLIVVFLAAFTAYWFDGFFSGPRFLFTIAPAFAYFVARGLTSVAAVAPRPIVRRVFLAFVPLCILTAWAGPTGVSSARGRALLYREQRTKLKTDLEAQLARARLHDAVVFVNDGWRGRLQARLRVLGVTQFRADRLLNTVDACALQTALDLEDALPPVSDSVRAIRVIARARAFGSAQLQEGLQADQTIALVPGSRPTAKCLWEFQRDSGGTLAYALALAHQRVGRDGRVDGDVIFVRDLGERNELLRQRFAGRTWLRYRLASSAQDTAAAFVPYWSR
jgi:hypothetical protein